MDCLTLNVWTPDLGAVGLPVMVWIYGGLWKHGASAMPQYDGAILAAAGAVVVTINYRVGFEGFGHLPGVPDNRGLRDQIAALEWVRGNIASFGGDPDKVTVFGQSAGAASIALLLAAPASAGLFRRAIAPVVDGDLVTGPPWQAIGAGVGRDVDLVCGFTHEEFRGINQGPVPSDVDLEGVAGALRLGAGSVAVYRDAHPGSTSAGLSVLMLSDALVRMPTIWVAEAHARAGGRTWLYDFAWQSSAAGAGHGVDVPFVFGNADNRYAARLLGSPPSADFGPLSQRMRDAWVSFAATGDPGWPRYDLDARRTRVWDTTPTDVNDPLAASRRIWSAAR